VKRDRAFDGATRANDSAAYCVEAKRQSGDDAQCMRPNEAAKGVEEIFERKEMAHVEVSVAVETGGRAGRPRYDSGTTVWATGE
jgi:hypothetical protein